MLAGVRSHVFSYGHRNPQGLVFGPGGRLYESEHGPDVDDEVNLIEPGGNYGWPRVAGYRDDKGYVYANWSASSPASCASLPQGRGAIAPSVPQQAESTFQAPDFKPPLQTFFTLDPSTEAQRRPGNTIAPGSLDIVTSATGVPGWNASLLLPTLLRGLIYRMALAPDGRSVVGAPLEYFKTTNRYRDLAVGPDQRTFYIVTDNDGRTIDEKGTPVRTVANPGAILEFKYVGESQDEHRTASLSSRGKPPFELHPHRFTRLVRRVGRNVDRLPHGQPHGAERLRHLRAVPAAGGPARRGLEVEWQQRVARGHGQPHRARLRHPCRAAGTVEREARRPARLHVAHELQQRALAAARRRSPGRAVAEALDDPRDPLAVEVLAGDDDDPAAPEEESGGEDPPVPERHHRLVAGGADGVEMVQARGAPPQGVAERGDRRVAEAGNRRRLEALPAGRSPVAAHHMPVYCGPPPPSGGTHVITP